MTYIDFTKRVLDYGNLDASGITSKYQRNKFGRKTKQFLEKKYERVFFLTELQQIGTILQFEKLILL